MILRGGGGVLVNNSGSVTHLRWWFISGRMSRSVVRSVGIDEDFESNVLVAFSPIRQTVNGG